MTKHGQKLPINLIATLEAQPLTPERLNTIEVLKEIKHYEVPPDTKSKSGAAYSE